MLTVSLNIHLRVSLCRDFYGAMYVTYFHIPSVLQSYPHNRSFVLRSLLQGLWTMDRRYFRVDKAYGNVSHWIKTAPELLLVDSLTLLLQLVTQLGLLYSLMYIEGLLGFTSWAFSPKNWYHGKPCCESVWAGKLMEPNCRPACRTTMLTVPVKSRLCTSPKPY